MPNIHPLFMLCLLYSLLLAGPLAAQNDTLDGPLVAVDTAQQDRIVIFDMADNTRRELTFGPYWHRVWGFSADGCRVGLTLAQGRGPSRIYSARLDGSDLRELVQYDDLPPDQWSAWHPQWSPDGSRVAFTMIRDEDDERSYHIGWVPAAGGVPEFYSVTGDEHEPVWSPDGAWLTYISYEERVAGPDIYSTAEPTRQPAPGQAAPDVPRLREADLWVVSADGQTKYRLTDFPTGSVRAPRWSPDGFLVGFVYSPSPANDQFWMIANAPGAIPTQLSQQWSLILDLTWLPDSSAMLAAVRDFQNVNDNRLWQIPLVGLADTDAFMFLDDPGLRYTDYPRFSPDGRWLAFRSAYTLAVVDNAAGAWQLPDAALVGNTPPVWSPAGFTGEMNCP